VDGFEAVSSVTSTEFTVAEFDGPAEADPGATVETTATVTDTGGGPGTGIVEYRFDGTVGNDTTVSLDPGEATTVSFTYVVPDETDPADYTHGVYSADSSQPSRITVRKSLSYAAANLTAPESAERGGALNATVSVTNDGELAGDDRTVELRLADPGNASDVGVVGAENVSLAPGNATTLSLNGTVPREFGTDETTVTVASPEDAASSSIRIAEAVGTVSGTVTDAKADAPLAGIDVVVKNGTEVVGTAVTGPEGSYAIDVPATELTVTASNATYARANQTVTLSESGDTATANFSLALRNGTLSGVVGANDGLDAPGDATVTVTNATGDAVTTVDADSNGVYEASLRPGSHDVTADAPNFDPVTESDVEIDPNATIDLPFELALHPAALSGTVIANATGDPVDGATVTVGPRSNTTDAAGEYSLTVPRGEYDVTASADGYADASETLALPANGSVDADFALPLPPEFTVTDLSGPAEIERGTGGDFSATVRNDGGVAGDVTVTFTDTATGTRQSVTYSDVAVDESRSATFTVSVDDAATGARDATASTPDGSRTASFEVVEGESDETTSSPSLSPSPSPPPSDDGTSGADGKPPEDDSENETHDDEEDPIDESENGTDDGEEESIDQPENGTADEPSEGDPVEESPD